MQCRKANGWGATADSHVWPHVVAIEDPCKHPTWLSVRKIVRKHYAEKRARLLSVLSCNDASLAQVLPSTVTSAFFEGSRDGARWPSAAGFGRSELTVTCQLVESNWLQGIPSAGDSRFFQKLFMKARSVSTPTSNSPAILALREIYMRGDGDR